VKKFFLITTLLFINESFAQEPDTLWTKTFGGSADDYGLPTLYSKLEVFNKKHCGGK